MFAKLKQKTLEDNKPKPSVQSPTVDNEKGRDADIIDLVSNTVVGIN